MSRGAAIAAGFLSAACTAQLAESEKTLTDASAIDAVERYHAAWEALDFDAVAAQHTDDFEYLFFTDVLPAERFPAILRDEWMSGVSEYEIDESDFRVRLLPPDHAHVTLAFDDRSGFEAGGVATTAGAMSYLLQRDGDEWKVRRLHHSGPLPDGLFEPK